jgi:monoterpene epsilon-lactone hydrolase
VARRRQAAGDRPPSLLTRTTRHVTTHRRGGAGDSGPAWAWWVLRPRRRTPVVRILYVHGGGYVHPLTKDYWRLARALSSAPAEVVVPAYPLAPDATVDDVLPLLLDLVHACAVTEPSLPMLLMGDSAGGALVLAMACRERDLAADGEPHGIAGVIGLSPWLDGTLDEASVADLEPSDPMLAKSGLRTAARWWAGGRGPANPLVSPLAADLRDLPPVDIYVGSRDILRPAVERLAARAERDDLDLHVRETVSMFHVWMTRAIPEGRRTRRDLTELVRRRARRR